MPPPIIIQIDPCNDPNLDVPPVTGLSRTANQDGVFGIHCAGGAGVQGRSSSGVGVRGISSSGVAVRGDSDSFLGVFGRSNTNDGIQGRSAAHDHAGVSAINESDGFGLFASSDGGGLAGVFNGGVKVTGNVELTGDLSVEGLYKGNIQCAGDIILLNQDLSEDFEIVSDRRPDPGTVMVIDAQGNLSECGHPYDKRVAGVIAGGGGLKPAIVLGRQPSDRKRLPVALVGKVSCKVDASYSPIEVGDLLTTSPTPGHAMRAAVAAKAFGAVIGKAMQPLGKGTGLIPILVGLQ
jgi:hypothetical protein